MRRNNRMGDSMKKAIAFNIAKNLLQNVNKSSGRSSRSRRTPTSAPYVNMPGNYRSPERNTDFNYNFTNTSKKRKTKANTDGMIAIAVICIFLFANVILNMLDFVINGAITIALIAILIVAIVFIGKFISKKSKERKEKKQLEEAEKFRIEEEERIKKEIALKKQKEEEEERRKNSTGNEELDKIILEGNEYIKKLREANKAIEHEGISVSIDRMEKAAKDIFAFVKDHPSQIPEIKKFMNYYLPTTLKLLNSYEKLSAQSVKGENIQSAMFDIEGMMETIASAFEKQLDFLFGTQVLDLQADISVMESILEQEGLKDSDTAPQLKL